MSKLVDSLIKDALTRLKHPSVQSALWDILFEALAPYLVAIVILWVLTFVGVAAILAFLVYILT